jgi:hypothetical protein
VLAPASVAAAAKPLVIRVDDDARPGGNGSGQSPYNNLPDAVAAARSSSAATVIKIAPGAYPLAATLVIDASLELRGSSQPVSVPDDPWPTGQVEPETETRIFATDAIGSQPLIRVGRGDGAVMRDVTIRDLVLEGTAAGIEILLNRVQGFTVADNVFRGPAFLGMQSVASSGQLTGNYFSGVGTGAILAGGYPESPSDVVATGNRSVNNSLGGMLLNGASINIPELGDMLRAVVRDNDLSNNLGSQGFGLRLFVLRRDPGAPGDSQSSARIDALVTDNRIIGNRIGVMIDAGFPYRSVGSICDPRTFSGAMDLELAGNTLAGSLQAPALVTFTRNSASLNPSTLSLWQYLHGASFAISDRDGTLANAWIDNPATDPYVGPCPADGTHESLGNVLTYNGSTLPPGRNF